MDTVIFQLSDKSVWKRTVHVYVKDAKGDLVKRACPFTTEHLVRKEDRSKTGRMSAAQYSIPVTDKLLLEAMYCDTAYGKDFYEVGDEKATKKLPNRVMTLDEKEMMAMRNLFETANLPFDSSKPLSVLKSMYENHMSAIRGVRISESTAKEVPIQVHDVSADIEAEKQKKRELYKETYGEDIPDDFANDSTLLSAVGIAGFNPNDYMASKRAVATAGNSDVDVLDKEPTIEELQKQYFDKFQKNPPNPTKNDASWLKQKLSGD